MLPYFAVLVGAKGISTIASAVVWLVSVSLLGFTFLLDLDFLQKYMRPPTTISNTGIPIPRDRPRINAKSDSFTYEYKNSWTYDQIINYSLWDGGEVVVSPVDVPASVVSVAFVSDVVVSTTIVCAVFVSVGFVSDIVIPVGFVSNVVVSATIVCAVFVSVGFVPDVVISVGGSDVVWLWT